MARPRKVSLSERIKQRRLSSRAPDPQGPRANAPDVLRVAPLPPLPAIEAPVVDAAPESVAPSEPEPVDAMPYLVLGSALQDTGRWPEAHRTYELCVKHATKGMLDECRAMLRR